MAFKHGISVVLTATALACAGPSLAQDAPTADTVVATVNGADITLGHMIVLKQRLPAQYQQIPLETLFEGILDQLVQQALLGQNVEKLTTGSRLALENEDRSLRAAEEVRRIMDDAVTDDGLQTAYEQAYGNVEPETEYNASHILVETEEEAAALVEELNSGADFATLAKEKSTGPSGPNGGELGWFSKGRMVPPFEEAVVAMEAGTVSNPVQTQFGWHVIRLNETRLKDAPTLDQVRDQLAETIRGDALNARIDELMASATVDRIEAGSVDASVLNDLSLISE